MREDFETIAAIATARGRGAIGVLRISGPQTKEVLDKVFRARKGMKSEKFGSFRLRFGSFTSASGETIDSGLAFFAKGPKSYTGEDYAELFCHGNPLILEEVLNSVLKSGASPAKPGEFTRRAFLMGKMDLTQCEGVDELIRANSVAYAGAAFRLQDGELRRKLEPLAESLNKVFAHMQGAIEFPEDIIEDRGKWLSESKKAIEILKGILKDSKTSAKVKDGLRVAIAGRPNAGKSSLFNFLLKEERALVTKVPGTTRDVLQGELEIAGLNIIIYDTAGLREAKGKIEALGVAKAEKILEDSDAVIWLFDGQKKISAKEKEELNCWRAKKPVLALVSKSDLGSAQEGFLSCSSLSGEGAELIRAFLKEQAEELLKDHEDLILLKARHEKLLKEALASLKKVCSGLEKGAFSELVASDLETGLEKIWEVTGRVTPNEILDIVFGEFCVGK
ncbi:tRNA uridine-5-carboxymethylaminomethyl(34) synthesis GTPase MnmE [bacterium]|nr:tRNA uridine-5-carboxymethylaminomethyl(34) synthesis GTPase MnmE [bacterium]